MRSGNGSIWPQHLYLMVSTPLPLLCKIGISKDADKRALQVSKKVVGSAVVVLKIWVPLAYHTEQGLHSLFRIFNVRYGNGKEWFAIIPVFPVALVLMVAILLFWFLLLAFCVLACIWVSNDCPKEPLTAITRLITK